MGAAEDRDGASAAMRGVTGPERDLLRALLREYNEEPARRAEIAARVEARFRRPLAILALDSSGFSRAVRVGGIVHYLALLERLAQLVRPLIGRNDGRVLYTEADNIFAAFPSATAALRCATAILGALDEANGPLAESDQIYVSMGVGYGEVLVVDDHSLHGDEMNLTCKLGEDLAQRGEVLLTTTAHAHLEPGDWRFEPVEFSIAGLDLPTYRLVR